jgi:hypothetical protein
MSIKEIIRSAESKLKRWSNLNFKDSHIIEIIQAMDIMEKLAKGGALAMESVHLVLPYMMPISKERAEEYSIIWNAPKREESDSNNIS